jgi:predicted SprT family Zn-dependent metalloprotease
MHAPPDADLLTRSFSVEELQHLWRQLNERHFQGRLPHIDVLWSSRLTASAAMFVSRSGPRSPLTAAGAGQRMIRLSTPLLHRQPYDELVNTLAHEMIHQWQFDLLKRRPNHGRDFCRKMAEMNRQGLQITIHHSLEDAVQRLAKYAWRCVRCGRAYERQRRTIRPGHHRCGACEGPLQEVSTTPAHPPAAPSTNERLPVLTPRPSRRRTRHPFLPPVSDQLELQFGFG